MRVFSYRQGNTPGVGVIADHESFVALSEAAPDLPRTLMRIAKESAKSP